MPEPSASEPTTGAEPRSLHPAAILVWSADVSRPAAAIAALYASGMGTWRLALLAGLGLAIGPAIIRYLRFRYALSAGTLHVEGGLLFHWARDIPLARVQSVDVVRKLRHRILGVVELRIEAVGGSSTEAALPALLPDEAERLRSLVLARSRETSEPATSPALAKMSPRDLLVYGATGGRVAVLAVVLAQAQELVPAAALEGVTDWFRGAGALVVVAFVGAALLVSILLSLAGTVLTFWDFVLTREEDRLVVRRGLFDQRRSEVPLDRIQAIRVEENLLRRTLGFASLRALVAGQHGSQEELQASSVLLPIAPRRQVLDVVAEVFGPEARAVAEDLDPVPARAAIGTLVGATLLAASTALGALLVDHRALLVLLAVPPLGAWGVAARRAKGSNLGASHVALRSGALVRTTTLAPVANVQSVELRVDPGQRPLGLATLRLVLAKGGAKVRGLDSSRAWSDFARLGRLLRDARPRTGDFTYG